MTLWPARCYNRVLAITEQLAQFNAFTTKLAEQEGDDLTIEQVYDRWWEIQHRDEEAAAIHEAHEAYEAGDRGEPAEQVIAEFRTERATSKKGGHLPSSYWLLLKPTIGELSITFRSVLPKELRIGNWLSSNSMTLTVIASGKVFEFERSNSVTD